MAAPDHSAQPADGVEALPTNCRNRLKAEGKPHPRSGCVVCKTGGLTGCPYERQTVESSEARAAADDLVIYGTAIMRDGKRIDPRTVQIDLAASKADSAQGDWVLVPRSATLEMERAWEGHYGNTFKGRYAAMLAAAPTPQPEVGRGEAVLWVSPEDFHNPKFVGINAVRAGHEQHGKHYTMPLYTTPTDAARVRDAEAWRWVTERAWFVDAAAYAFDLRFGPGDFSTEPRNADADDVREAIFAAIEEEAALAAVEGEG